MRVLIYECAINDFMNFKSEEKEQERDREKKQKGRKRDKERKKKLLGIYALRKLKTKNKIKNQIRRAAENQRKTRKSIHSHKNYHVICKQ